MKFLKKAENKSALQTGAEAVLLTAPFFFFLLLFKELMASDFFLTLFKGLVHFSLLAIETLA